MPETSQTCAADVMVPVEDVVHPDHPLREALARMRQQGIDLLPVVDGDAFVGVLTATDIRGDTSRWEVDERTAVRDVMSAEIAYCFEDDSLATVRAVMTESGHGRLPVLNRDRELVGLVPADRLDDRSRAGAPEAHLDARAANPGRSTSVAGHSRESYRPRPTLKPRG